MISWITPARMAPTPVSAISEAGYRWGAGASGEPLWAENVAAGYDDPAAVVAGWMASAGHRQTILTCSFRAIGVALAREAHSTYGTYWTAEFAIRPRSDASPGSGGASAP